MGLVFKKDARSLLNTEGWLQVYRSFGLGSSYADVMRFDCLLQYSEYEANDRNFPDFPSRLQGNIYQVPMCPFSCSSKCDFDEMIEGRASSQFLSSMITWLVFQMGGDFLLDKTGKVLFSHYCKTPLDRPNLEDVLQAADSTEH